MAVRTTAAHKPSIERQFYFDIYPAPQNICHASYATNTKVLPVFASPRKLPAYSTATNEAMENIPLIPTLHKFSSEDLTTDSDAKWDSQSTDLIAARVPVQHTKRLEWFLAIIAGQALLLAFSWGFFAIVSARGQVPLPLTLAEIVQLHPQSTTYVVTFLATALSTFSSYLFSQAIRHAILVHLMKPMALSTLEFGMRISTSSLIFERRELKWVAVAAVLSMATLNQTASWTSLLTPVNIVVPTPLEGTEIDFSSSAFSAQFSQLWPTLIDYRESFICAGATSASSQTGYPALLDFNGWAHNISTHGIFPMVFVDSAEKPKIAQLVTSNTEPLPPFWISSNASMSQQGLTATVSCQPETLDENSDPPLERFAQTEQLEQLALYNQTSLYTILWATTTCQGETVFSDTQLSFTNDTMFVSLCPDPESGPATIIVRNPTTVQMAVIIDGGLDSTYYSGMGTMVCTVTPQIQNMTVTYTGWQLISTQPDTAYPPVDAGVVGSAALYGLKVAFEYGQSQSRNSIGDAIWEIYREQAQTVEISLSMLWEAYITGVVEFVGTASKQNFWDHYSTVGGNPPVRAINGKLLTPTLGWEYTTTTMAALIPSTFVAIASILIVLFAQLRNRGIPIRQADFNPNDPILLMAAASAGGIPDTFFGLAQDDVKKARGKRVKLSEIGGRDGFSQV
ncbi:hypothetical protein C8R44DRAFT_885142 [Mycena epipterygia]|nr:hypothetical protein C8R44DRAFT_885142 [Mycena epipterygia]